MLAVLLQTRGRLICQLVLKPVANALWLTVFLSSGIVHAFKTSKHSSSDACNPLHPAAPPPPPLQHTHTHSYRFPPTHSFSSQWGICRVDTNCIRYFRAICFFIDGIQRRCRWHRSSDVLTVNKSKLGSKLTLREMSHEQNNKDVSRLR